MKIKNRTVEMLIKNILNKTIIMKSYEKYLIKMYV